MKQPASSPKVFVVILNHNGGEVLRDCLRGVFQLTYPNFEVLLIDNASTDGSFEMARNNFSRAHFIQSEKNVGFSAGNNLGIRFALEKMADYVFLLNPDAIVEKNALDRLIEEAEKNPTAGLLSPLIFKDDGPRLWFSGGQIEWVRMKTIHSQNQPAGNSPYFSEYLTGCALLVKKEVFRRIGLLDEDFFLYWEDADFSWRARKNNFQLLIVPAAQVFHFEKSNANLEFKTYWLVFSGLIFFHKNSISLNRPWFKLYFLARKLKNNWDLKNRKNPLAPIVKKAYNDYAVWLQKNRKSRS